MSEMIEIVKSFLEAEGLKYLENDNSLVLRIHHEVGQWNAFISETNGALLCYSEFPMFVVPERRKAVAEFLMRMNWLLLAGNWEIDFKIGEVRYKTAVPLRRVELTHELVKNICYTNFATFGSGMTEILSVITPAPPVDETAQIQAGFEECMRKIGFEDNPPTAN